MLDAIRNFLDSSNPSVGLILFLLLIPGLLAGCPSVDPGPLDPIFTGFSEDNPGPVLSAACHYEGEPRRDLPAARDRIIQQFDAYKVLGYRIRGTRKPGEEPRGEPRGEHSESLTALKTILNPQGLLRDLEVNRFLSAFIRGCAEDRWLTFFREEELIRKEPIREVIREVLVTRKENVISTKTQAFLIHDEVTPLLFTFEKAALRIPLDKVELGFKPDATRVTLTIRDVNLIASLRKNVGWSEEEDPYDSTGVPNLDRFHTERTLYAAVAGLVLIVDVIRPGAQVFQEEGEGPRWEFGGFMKVREKSWLVSLFKQPGNRALLNYVFRFQDEPEPLEGDPPSSW